MIDPTVNPDDVKHYGIVGTILVGLLFGAQRALKIWKITGAETSVVSTMSEELKRLSTHNMSLMERLSELQTELINVKQVISDLTIENSILKSEVTTLTDRVSTLNKTLENQKER